MSEDEVPPPEDSPDDDAPPPSLKPNASGERERGKLSRSGPLAWMAQNAVAANLLMFLLLIGGALMSCQVKQEVFPEFNLDMVTISVAYPGASPAEVEQAVVLAVEEAVRGVDGVKEVRSNANEGIASIAVELHLGTDGNKGLADIKSAVDRITTFPAEVERPTVSLAQIRNQVLSMVIYGDLDEAGLREIGERARDELVQDERITYAELSSVRPLEISVEVPQRRLREYGLTLEDVRRSIRAASIELPSGSVKTDRGEILLRTTERRDRGQEFGDITILSRPDGSQVRLRDIADVRDGFRETDLSARFNGKPAVVLSIFRVGSETPLDVSAAAKEYMETARTWLPPGAEVTYWGDRSEMYRDRVNLLLKNAALGLILVILTLGLFLEIRLAFWVTLGIPISFVGALLFMPTADVSINMISLFAFIVTLGIVVDDAIVVGEAVFKRRRDGMSYMDAAVAGMRDVAMPVVFSVLTTVIAFSPLLFVPGIAGKFFRVIPVIVITVLLLSLVESLLILPAHLAHGKKSREGSVMSAIERQQSRISRGLERFIENVYRPTLLAAVRHKWLTITLCLSMLFVSIGMVASGRVGFTFMPKIEADTIFAKVRLPVGTPVDTTERAQKQMLTAAQEVMAEFGGEAKFSLGMFSQTGAHSAGGGVRGGASTSGGHLAEVLLILVPPDEREFTAGQFAKKWRERIGDIAGAETLQFTYSTGASAGAPIDVQLSHRELGTLEAAATELTTEIKKFSGVKDIENGFSAGKLQLDFELTDEARARGLTEDELARQLRNSFSGGEAVRQQRGRNEVRIYVRLPEEERRSMFHVENMMLRTPNGGELPLSEAAIRKPGRAYTDIRRWNGQRIISVTADVQQGEANATQVVADVEKDIMPQLLKKYPGLTYTLAGEQQEQGETLKALGLGFLMALLAMYALLAIPLRSYIQPVVIMGAIPFGFTGMIIGHVIMGYDLSIMSLMGFVALSGVVVNDSLVMIVTVNENRELGMSPFEAVISGATRRFRPIMLTSLTTFFGLAPMIIETSVQARFLIPMALSLGFGVMFATIIMLGLIPCFYLVIEGLREGSEKRSRPGKEAVFGPNHEVPGAAE